MKNQNFKTDTEEYSSSTETSTGIQNGKRHTQEQLATPMKEVENF